MTRTALLVFQAVSCASILIPLAADAQTSPKAKVIHYFAAYSNGSNPYASLIRNASGDLFGTTYTGGAGNLGTVYRVDASGNETVLYSFVEKAQGSYPYSGVSPDAAGNLYGTTLSGGAQNFGVVYKLEPGGTETVLHSFTGGADGGNPYAGVILDDAGNLYGTTWSGGTSGDGVVYKIDTAGNETVLYSFTDGNDGGHPYAGVIRDSSGNLYGTTFDGGANGTGTVYEITAAGQEKVLFNFGGFGDESIGQRPYAGLIRDSAGNLYGTTSTGGPNGGGLVYKLDPEGNETVVSGVPNGESNVIQFNSGVVMDRSGNLYGTCYFGAGDYGSVYQVDSTGHQTVLYTFSGGADGGNPYAAVVLDPAGNLYGTTSGGGAANSGVVYELTPTGQETVLNSFPAGPDGGDPDAGVIGDGQGNLYGTTYGGGVAGLGTVYRISSNGQETVLHSFAGGSDGANPYAALVMDGSGNFYGTTTGGGTYNVGTVFKIDASGTESVLYSFAGISYGLPDGGNPYGALTLDSVGNLYGTLAYRGSQYYGAIFKLSSTGQETVLFDFGQDDVTGSYPYSNVVLDEEGNLYGTASSSDSGAGLVYQLTPAGEQIVLHVFGGTPDGYDPRGSLIRDLKGNLYGTTVSGGLDEAGIVYRVDVQGNETILYTFTGGADGGSPYSGVVADKSGNLYGTASSGGANNYGVVYKLDTSGNQTVLYNFTGRASGAIPYGGVLLDGKGDVYGTTSAGGIHGFGVVFMLQPQ